MRSTGDEINKRTAPFLRSPPQARPKPQGCQMLRGFLGGRQMPGPRAVIKFQMPTPGIKTSKCPAITRGGGWALLELTDA